MKLLLRDMLFWVGILLFMSGFRTHDVQPSYRISAQEENRPVSILPGDNQFLLSQLPSRITTPPEQVSISTLLADGLDFHQQLVTIRGIIVQPELHVDDSQLFLDFVFRLSQGKDSLVVFGRHDRTRGAPSISMNLPVEVVGIFWKSRDLNGSVITNTIEAQSVNPYPSSIPNST